MFAPVSNCFHLSSPLEMEEDAPKAIEKQGVVSILGSQCEGTRSPSLRRTLSADMSSKKWLADNGFPPMKRIASFDDLAREEQSDVWERIQSDKEESERQNTWSSILSQKANDSCILEAPYVHPLIKRSARSLNAKSLEICTESLGSETGSDGFSSYPSSDMGEEEEDKVEVEQEKELFQSFNVLEEVTVAKYDYPLINKKLTAKTFPPPLRSLAWADGASLQMQSHRENGRLVLQAVSVSPMKYFRAFRQEGRLLLTLANGPSKPSSYEEINNFETKEALKNFEDGGIGKKRVELEKEGENKGREMEFVIEQGPKISGVISVHRSALMMKSVMGLNTRNLTWPKRFNKAVNLVEVGVEEEGEPTHLPHSLLPCRRMARLQPSPPQEASAAATFNAYEYFWRTKPAVVGGMKPIGRQCSVPPETNSNNVIISNNSKRYERQDLLLFRGKNADYLVPLEKGCKQPKRPLLIWEPHCVVTS